jgi:hypothetical protein
MGAGSRPEGLSRALPALVAGGLALALYVATLAPGLTWAHDGADGGDFLAAALTGGVPHPTGYPAYQLLLQAAIRLLPVEPARAGNWLSAICAALAAGLLADLARRSLPPAPWRGVVALAAGLAWATSPALWSQAVITEVYALNALAVVLVLWLLWQWGHLLPADAGWRWLAAAALVLGLGLGNHLSLALALPGLAVWLWMGQARLSRLSRAGAAGLAALLLLGLAVYARVPLAAAAEPPVNWGGAHTPAGFWWLVSGGPYRGLVGGMGGSELLTRLSSLVGAALDQLGGGPWGAALAVVGLWQLDRRHHAWWRTTGLLALLFALYGLLYRTDTAFVYLIPAWGMAALWLGEGIDRLARLLTDRRAAWVLVIGLTAALPLSAIVRFYPLNDARRDARAETFTAQALAQAEEGAVILTATDRPTFALWYAVYGLGRRSDIVPLNVNLYGYDWYRATLAHHYPALFTGLAEDASLEAVVRAAAARRPVYAAEPLPVALPGLALHNGEPLARLRPVR